MDARAGMVEPLVLEIARIDQPADPASADPIADTHPRCRLLGG